MKNVIRIATRKSPLAMWQAEFVAKKLREIHCDLSVEIIGMSTRGDEILDKSLSKIGGKGLFVKELEHALIEGRADIAVHSMKDVGVNLPDELMLGALLSRHSPFDAVVSDVALEALSEGAVVGTSSLRRMCQLKSAYPHLTFKPLRGNIHTRLAKLDAGEFDAIILAESGLIRMGMDARIHSVLSAEECLPGIAQGTLGIECRSNDADVLARIAPLVDEKNALITIAERAVNDVLQGSCQTPIAAYAKWLEKDDMTLTAGVFDPDNLEALKNTQVATVTDRAQAQELGMQVGKVLLSMGAQEILAKTIN